MARDHERLYRHITATVPSPRHGDVDLPSA